MLKSLAFLTAVSMVCGFNPGSLEKEYTEIYEDHGFQNYEYYHTFSSGTFNSPGSRLDGCKKYTTINDMILYDYPEVHENYDSLIVSSDIAPGYMDALKGRVDKNLSEYFLLCPLETAKSFDAETNTMYDSGNYLMKAVWQEAPEIVVRSKDQSVPIDMDKLKEIIPEARLDAPYTQYNKESYVFYITTNRNRPAVTFASELDYLLTEEDIKTVINCRNDSLASVEFNGNWYSNMIYLPKNPHFSVDDIETVSEFFTSKNIGFSVTDCEDNKNRKTIVFDEEIPAAEYMELEFELGEKTGITCGQLSYYETATERIANNSIEYFDIVSGDANNDGELSLADAILVLQSIGNPDEYRLTQQGKYNADVYNPGDGITTSDAVAIQQKLLGLID